MSCERHLSRDRSGKILMKNHGSLREWVCGEIPIQRGSRLNNWDENICKVHLASKCQRARISSVVALLEKLLMIG